MRSPLCWHHSTHIQLTDSVGQSMVRTSCGTEGFKNIKKSTPVAAQTAGISAAAVSVCLHPPATGTSALFSSCQLNQYVEMNELCFRPVKLPTVSLETLVFCDPLVEKCWLAFLFWDNKVKFLPKKSAKNDKLPALILRKHSSLCLRKEKCSKLTCPNQCTKFKTHNPAFLPHSSLIKEMSLQKCSRYKIVREAVCGKSFFRQNLIGWVKTAH